MRVQAAKPFHLAARVIQLAVKRSQRAFVPANGSVQLRAMAHGLASQAQLVHLTSQLPVFLILLTV